MYSDIMNMVICLFTTHTQKPGAGEKRALQTPRPKSGKAAASNSQVAELEKEVRTNLVL